MALRYRAGFDPALASAILELFLRTVFGWLRRKARDEGVADGRAGAITVIQRAGRSVNTDLHDPSLVLDGVYGRRDPGSPPRFHATAPPSRSDLADSLTTVQGGLRRRLACRGLIRNETGGDEADPHAEAAPLLAPCCAAAVPGTVDLGPEAGQYGGRCQGTVPPPIRPESERKDEAGPGDGGSPCGPGAPKLLPWLDTSRSASARSDQSLMAIAGSPGTSKLKAPPVPAPDGRRRMVCRCPTSPSLSNPSWQDRPARHGLDFAPGELA
jgi:hypothetical protein